MIGKGISRMHAHRIAEMLSDRLVNLVRCYEKIGGPVGIHQRKSERDRSMIDVAARILNVQAIESSAERIAASA